MFTWIRTFPLKKVPSSSSVLPSQYSLPSASSSSAASASDVRVADIRDVATTSPQTSDPSESYPEMNIHLLNYRRHNLRRRNTSVVSVPNLIRPSKSTSRPKSSSRETQKERDKKIRRRSTRLPSSVAPVKLIDWLFRSRTFKLLIERSPLGRRSFPHDDNATGKYRSVAKGKDIRASLNRTQSARVEMAAGQTPDEPQSRESHRLSLDRL